MDERCFLCHTDVNLTQRWNGAIKPVVVPEMDENVTAFFIHPSHLRSSVVRSPRTLLRPVHVACTGNHRRNQASKEKTLLAWQRPLKIPARCYLGVFLLMSQPGRKQLILFLFQQGGTIFFFGLSIQAGRLWYLSFCEFQEIPGVAIAQGLFGEW